MKAYRPRSFNFKFPFRGGRRSQAAGSYNPPARAGGQMPGIKQFSAMKPGRPTKRQKK